MPETVERATTSRGSELQALRDTRIVLGHWYAEVLPNAMALQDFSALAAMVQVSLGHARVLDALLREADGLPPSSAVAVPGQEELASMQLLDSPPRDWPDFVVSAALSEWALAVRLDRIARGEGNTAGAVARLLSESSFVVDYLSGWLRVLTEDEPALLSRLDERAALLATWYADATDDEWTQVLRTAREAVPGWAAGSRAWVPDAPRGGMPLAGGHPAPWSPVPWRPRSPTERSSDVTAPTPPACPHCASTGVSQVAHFGTSASMSQWHCAGCGSVFEQWRYGLATALRADDGRTDAPDPG